MTVKTSIDKFNQDYSLQKWNFSYIYYNIHYTRLAYQLPMYNIYIIVIVVKYIHTYRD